MVASVKYKVPPGPVMIAESKFWKPRMDGLTGTTVVNVGVVEPAAISINSLPAGAVNQRLLALSTAIPTVEGSGPPFDKKVEIVGVSEGLLGLLIPTLPVGELKTKSRRGVPLWPQSPADWRSSPS